MALLSLIYVAAAAELTLLGQTKSVDRFVGLTVVEGTVFAAARGSGLVAVDVRRPGEAKELWRVSTGGEARGVEVVGNTVYVADRRTGLRVVQHESVVGGFPEPCLEVQVSGDVAYVRSTQGEVVAFNVTSSNPEFLGKYNESIAEAFFVVGTTVYTMDYASSQNRNHYLSIIDFSTPSSPVLLGSVETNRTYISTLFVSDTTAYVTSFDRGLLIFNVTDPSSPSFTAVYDNNNNNVVDVDVVNGTAYIVSFNRFEVVDVSSNTPSLIGTARVEQTTRVRVIGTTAYLAGHNGVQMLSVEAPSSPVLLGEFNPPGGDGRAVAMAGDNAYLVGGKTLLQVVDVRDPSSPVVVGVHSGSKVGKTVQVAGSTVYVGGCDFLHTFDVSDPRQPRLLGEYGSSSTRAYCTFPVHVIGTVAYVGSDFDGFEVLDVSDPSAITRIGIFDLRRIKGMFVSGTTAFVTSSSEGLVVLDVGTPSSPTLIGSLGAFRYATAVAVRGVTVYVADGGSLHAVDVSTPSAPTVVGLFEVGSSVNDVKVVGDTVLVSFDEGLQLVDVSNPSAMRRIDGYASTSPLEGIAVMGNLAYVAEVGMSVIKMWNETLAPSTVEPAFAVSTVEPAFVVSTGAPTTTAPTKAPSTESNKKGLAIILIVVGAVVLLIVVVGVWWCKQHRAGESKEGGNVDTQMRGPVPSDQTV